MPRPKRPTPPPEPPLPPPIPGVVTPEDLDAINTPEIDKLPAYISPGKFQWKPPLPGPKGDTGEPGEQGDPGEKGEPGEPGVIARPITPAVTADEIAPGAVTEEKLATDSVTQTKIARNTVGWSEIRAQSLEPEQIKTLSGEPPLPGQVPVYDESEGNQWWFRWADAATRPLTPQVATEEIADGAVTQDKLDPALSLGDRIVTGTVFDRSSVEGLYLPSQSVPIDWTVADLSSWIPAGAKYALVQIGIFTQSADPNTQVEMRVRTDAEQREAICVTSSRVNKTAWNSGIVPLTAGRTLEYRLDVTGVINVTLWITVVGYII